VKVRLRGRSRSCERFSAWRKAPARQFGRKMSRRASLKIKQSKKLAPSVGESEQITRTLMSDREIKLELASEAIGRGCPAKLAFWLVTTKIPGHRMILFKEERNLGDRLQLSKLGERNPLWRPRDFSANLDG